MSARPALPVRAIRAVLVAVAGLPPRVRAWLLAQLRRPAPARHADAPKTDQGA